MKKVIITASQFDEYTNEDLENVIDILRIETQVMMPMIVATQKDGFVEIETTKPSKELVEEIKERERVYNWLVRLYNSRPDVKKKEKELHFVDQLNNPLVDLDRHFHAFNGQPKVFKERAMI